MNNLTFLFNFFWIFSDFFRFFRIIFLAFPFGTLPIFSNFLRHSFGFLTLTKFRWARLYVSALFEIFLDFWNYFCNFPRISPEFSSDYQKFSNNFINYRNPKNSRTIATISICSKSISCCCTTILFIIFLI